MNTDAHDSQDSNPEHRDDPCSMTLIAIGSNLGNSVEIVEWGFDQLQTLSTTPIQTSSLWRSTPIDCPPSSPDFINAAATITPLQNETPESLLAKLQALEITAGRQPKVLMNEPRPLDLDLIAFANEQRSTLALTLPHPRFHQRRFVLAPLAEIAPEAKLPGQTQSITELLADLDTDETLIRL